MTGDEPHEELRIGQWRLIPALNLLRRDGETVRLEPRHVDLLLFLAQRQGEVVGAEHIFSSVWGGQIVGDHSLYQAIAKLRKALGDGAAKPSYIETIPKRGYRLIADVSAVGPSADTAGDPTDGVESRGTAEWKGRPLPRALPAHLGWLILLAILVAAVLAGLWFMPLRSPNGPSLGPRTLVVLPFSSLSREEADRFIAQGFSIELANLLGRSRNLHVLGPVSTKLVAESELEPVEISRRLGVDTMVSGNLRRSSGRLRISATITDTATGYQMWGHIFDRPDQDIFALQRGVAVAIAKVLQERLDEGVSPQLKDAAPEHREAYDDLLLGDYYRSQRSSASLQRALHHYRRALEADPGFLAAKREMATTYLLLSFYGDLPLLEAIERAKPLLEDCLRQYPRDWKLLGTIGLSHYLQGAYGLAQDYLRQAVEGAPNFVEGWMWLGLTQQQQGRLLDALAAFEHARDLEPLMVTAATNQANALAWSGSNAAARRLLEELTTKVDAHAQLFRTLSNLALEAGDLVAAHRWAAKALAADPEDPLPKANMAMVLGYLRQEEAAVSMAALARAGNPTGRAVQLYLDRLSILAPGLLPPDTDEAYLSGIRDGLSLPEIEWRLANGRTGLAHYFSGDAAAARDRLAKSLDGRDYPIERTDYDLFLCTSLVDAARRAGDAAFAARWLEHCERDLADARRHGWKSLALDYVRARGTMLKGARADALEQLGPLVDRGFRNLRLLQMDPVFAPLRDELAFRGLVAEIDAFVQRSWAEISAAAGEG